MRELTIREALECEDSTSGFYLYLYRDREVIFYIGQSGQPFERLRGHLGRDDRNAIPDRVGRLIIDNRPASLSWTIEVYRLEEIPMLLGRTINRFDQTSLDFAELDLIAMYGPCLNIKHNRNRKPLPLRYIRDSAIANEGVILE